MALRLLLPAAVLSLLLVPGEVSSAAAPADHVPPPPPRPARLHSPAQERRAHHRKHLSRHRRHLQDSSDEHSAALASRQVRDSREAHRRWLKRDEVELIRRTAPSNLPPVCHGTAPAYAQCGGTGFSGDTCCVTGYTCTYANDYYSQCLPSAASTTSSTTSSAAPSQTPSGCTGAQTAYGQCGGTGYTGASCCPAGYFCSYSNPFYSQCVPTTSTSATSSTPSSTSSTSSSSSSSSTTSRSSSSSTSTTTSAAPSPSACSGIQLGYGQCGGIGWSGPTCCVSGWTCTYSNDFFSQCLPSASPSPTTSTSSSTHAASSSSTTSSSTTSASASASSSATGTCSGSAGAYAQCGGSGYIGGTCCPSGYYCAAANAYYSQCLPGSAPSTTTTSSSTSSSSQTPPPSSTSSSTSASSTPSAACSGIQTGYGQCGGIGWSGPTCCPASFVCTYSNSFYSQCLPASGSSTTSSASSSSSSSISSASTKSSTSSAASSSTSSGTSPISTAAAFAQCGGQGFTAQLCPSGFICAIVNPYFSQCLPAVPSVTYTTALPSGSSSSSATKTSTSSAPTATPTCGTCNIASGGSDGCTPYTVGYSGVTLPQGQTYPAGGHVNYQAIPKSQYVAGQTYLKPGSKWTPQSFGMQFDPNNNQPGGVYIGRNFFDFSQAAAAFPQGYCITWVQLAQYNQHFGEGGQCPICTP